MGVTSAVRMVENLVGHPDISIVHYPDSVFAPSLRLYLLPAVRGENVKFCALLIHFSVHSFFIRF